MEMLERAMGKQRGTTMFVTESNRLIPYNASIRDSRDTMLGERSAAEELIGEKVVRMFDVSDEFMDTYARKHGVRNETGINGKTYKYFDHTPELEAEGDNFHTFTDEDNSYIPVSTALESESGLMFPFPSDLTPDNIDEAIEKIESTTDERIVAVHKVDDSFLSIKTKMEISDSEFPGQPWGAWEITSDMRESFTDTRII